jgi:hypothetical protein
MAVIYKEDEEKDEQQDQGGQVGQSTSAPMSGGAGQTAPTARQQQGSGQAPNIQKYIEANQGGGSQLAQGLQQQAQKQAQNLQKGVDTSRTAFQQKAGEVEGKLGDQGEQLVKTSFKDPQAILQNQQQLDEFKRLQSGGYQDQIGQAAQNLTPFQQQQQQLAQASQMAGTESGRFQMLQQTFGKPTYSQGQQRLDQLLLQGTPNASRSLQYDIGNLAKQAGQQIGQFGEEQQAKLDALQNLSSTRSQQIQDMLQYGESQDQLESDMSGRGLRDIESDLQNRLNQIRQSAPEMVAGLRDRLANNKLTEKDLSDLGLTAGTRLFNTELDKYINQSAVNPTTTGIANQDEFARFQALRQLAGDTEVDIFGGATEVGGYNPYDFASQRLQTDLKQKETDVQNLVAETKNVVSNPFMSQSSRSGGQTYAESMVNQGLNPALPYHKFVLDLRQLEQNPNPTYNDILKVAQSFKAGVGALSPKSRLGVQPILEHYGPAFEKYLQNADVYQYDRMLQPVPDNFQDIGKLV